jgi:hypothetical protein
VFKQASLCVVFKSVLRFGVACSECASAAERSTPHMHRTHAQPQVQPHPLCSKHVWAEHQALQVGLDGVGRRGMCLDLCLCVFSRIQQAQCAGVQRTPQAATAEMGAPPTQPNHVPAWQGMSALVVTPHLLHLGLVQPLLLGVALKTILQHRVCVCLMESGVVGWNSSSSIQGCRHAPRELVWQRAGRSCFQPKWCMHTHGR